MRYNINTNQPKCLDYGITYKESAIMGLFDQLPLWADQVMIGGQQYYYLSRGKVLEELPLLFNTRQTIYRHFKTLDKKGMIDHIAEDGFDYVKLTAKGQEWIALGKKYKPLKKNTGNREKKYKPLPKKRKSKNSRLAPVNTGNKSDFEPVKGSKKNTTDNNNIAITKESDNHAPAHDAFDFLKANNPERLETWLMQHKSQIKGFKKFIADYNDTVNIEQLPYDSRVLFSRLSKFARNWIKNYDKFHKRNTDESQPTYMGRKIL